jgi:hypothetical protein
MCSQIAHLETEVATYHGVFVAGGDGGCARRALASLAGAGGLSEQVMEETAMIDRASSPELELRRSGTKRFPRGCRL